MSISRADAVSGKWLLLLLAACFTIGVAGWGRLYNETDGQYSGAAKIMTHGGSWIVPENNGAPRLVKPPLLYWGMTAGFKLFGMNEFAARLPNALAIIFWVWITWHIGFRFGGPRVGFLSGGLLLSFLGSATLARIIMPEPIFAASVAAAVACILEEAREARGRSGRWVIGFWFFSALACFSKGIHGLLYAVAIVAVLAVIFPARRKVLSAFFSPAGILLFLAIMLPWHIAVEIHHPGFLRNLFFNEYLGHFLGQKITATGYTNVPRWQFLLLHLAWFFPWSFVTLWMLLVRKGEKNPHPDAFISVTLGVWAALVFLSVMFAGQRQDYYAMTLWPVAAIAMAAVINSAGLRRCAKFLAGFSVLLFVATFCAYWFVTHGDFGATNTAARSTAWRTVSGLDAGIWREILSRFLFVFPIAGVCWLGAVWTERKSPSKMGPFLLILGALVIQQAAVGGTASVAPYFSLANIAIPLNQSRPMELAYDGPLNTGSSLMFYYDGHIDFLVSEAQKARFSERWHTDAPVALITEARLLPVWEKALGMPLKAEMQSGTQVLVRNRH